VGELPLRSSFLRSRLCSGDVVGDTDFSRLAFTCRNDSSGITEVQGHSWSRHVDLV